MIKNVHNIFSVLILLAYIRGDYLRKKYLIPYIYWWVTGSINKKYLNIIKGYFNQSNKKLLKLWMGYLVLFGWYLNNQ